jgi:hypothetical protein
MLQVLSRIVRATNKATILTSISLAQDNEQVTADGIM